ncbi:amidohydrolase family protein [Xanthomonas sp. Kuri4-2]
MTRHTLPVALIQERNHGDAEANLAVIESRVAEAAAQGARLVLLQELHNGAYFCQHESVGEFDLAEPIPGPSTERLGALAKRHGVVIVGSLFERRAAGLYHNTAVVLEKDGTLLGKYRKMHIPDDPGFYEKFYFTPGDIGFRPIDTSVGRLGVLVCWDQWYPEAARLMALAGAELLLYPTAIGWDPDDEQAEQDRQRDAWVLSHRGHAVANGLPWEQGLAGLTRVPARIFGVDDSLGSIAVGKRADLVLWDGDPLDVGHYAEQVWLGGRAMPMRSRQTELRDRYLAPPGALPRAYSR